MKLTFKTILVLARESVGDLYVSGEVQASRGMKPGWAFQTWDPGLWRWRESVPALKDQAETARRVQLFRAAVRVLSTQYGLAQMETSEADTLLAVTGSIERAIVVLLAELPNREAKP